MVPRCLLPAKIASIIRRCPQLVSEAVRAFVERDTNDMKVVSRMAYFPPVNFVHLLVHFHRCAYAQLVQQRLQAPKGYPMPPFGDPSFKGAELGMKLTAGIEILYHRSSRHITAGEGVEGNEVRGTDRAWAPAQELLLDLPRILLIELFVDSGPCSELLIVVLL